MKSMGPISVSWLNPLIDFVLPPLCLGCGEHEETPERICADCWKQIETIEHPICLACLESLPQVDRCPICGDEGLPLYVYGHYQAPLDQIVIQFKFHGITHVAETLSHLLLDKFATRLGALDVDGLVPIPLHPGRENRRGYNQARLLAEALSVRLRVPVTDDHLQRIHRRRPQSRMRRGDRADNIRGVFRCDMAGDGRRVLLVDDVVTSGSTVDEARQTLRDSGFDIAGAIAIAYGG